MNEAVQRYYKEAIAIASAGAIPVCGWLHCRPVTVAYTITAAGFVWLLLNPWRLFSWKMCDRERYVLASVIALFVGAFAVPGLPWVTITLYDRITFAFPGLVRCAILCVSCLLALIWYRNRLFWRQDFSLLQSVEVNQTLEHYTKGGQWAAGQAWDRYGRSETAAVIRQGLNITMDEADIDRILRPVFWLGYADGVVETTTDEDKLIREKEQLLDKVHDLSIKLSLYENELKEMPSYASKLKDAENEIAQLRRTVRAQEEQLTAMQDRAVTEEEPAEPENAESVTDRNRRMLELHKAGMSYTELAAMFCMSQSGAKTAVRRAKAVEPVVSAA